MGRELRLIDNECLYHVTCRGNNRGPIVWDAHDYDSLANELDRAAKLHRWDVFAWAILTNHYHALIRTPEGGFSVGFQVMNGTHSRRTNRRHGRTDHLFRNRPKATPVESNAHLAAAILYIARNPVEAGLCETPRAWRWSSYRAAVGATRAPAWLALDEVHALFGSTRPAAQAALERLVCDGPVPVSDTEEMPAPMKQ